MCRRVVFGQYRIHYGLFFDGSVSIINLLSLRPEIIDMKTKYVVIIDSMGYGISMQLFLKNILCRFIRGLLTVYFSINGIIRENRSPCKTEQLRIGEKVFDSLMIVAKLGTMALIKYKNNPFIPQRQQTLLIILFVIRIKRNAQLLNGRYDYFIRIIRRQHPSDQFLRVRILFNGTFLKLIELLTGLPVQILPVDNK